MMFDNRRPCSTHQLTCQLYLHHWALLRPGKVQRHRCLAVCLLVLAACEDVRAREWSGGCHAGQRERATWWQTGVQHDCVLGQVELLEHLCKATSTTRGLGGRCCLEWAGTECAPAPHVWDQPTEEPSPCCTPIKLMKAWQRLAVRAQWSVWLDDVSLR